MGRGLQDRVLLWADVETGGLTPNIKGPEYLLEIALIPTNATGKEVLAEPTEYVMHFPQDEVEWMKEKVDPVVLDMHEESGLWTRVSDPHYGFPTYKELDEALLEYISEFAPRPREARLAGSNVGFDLNFVEVFLPSFYSHLHYQSLDVSSLYFVAETYGIDIDDRISQSKHNAMSDIARSLETYRRFVRKTGLSGRLKEW